MSRFRECYPRSLSRLGFFVALAAAGVVEAQSVRGLILDNDSGAPIAGALIQARAGDLSEPSPNQTQSDSAGAFALDLNSGSWRLQARCIGYRSIERLITVNSGITESVVLLLEPHVE